MASSNQITGDALISKATTKEYSEGWDRIFGKKTLHDEYHEMMDLLKSDTPSTDDHGIQTGTEK